MVNYSYLADGSKAEALKADGTGLVYRGSLIYRKAADGTLTLESAATPTGYLTPTGVRYHITDHLGSVVGVVDGSNGALYQASEYAPYGERTDNAAVTVSSAPAGETYRDHFTGKESQDPDFTVPYLDYGARLYSPALYRWLTPDPLSEKYYDFSLYSYCAGNPIRFTDEDGRRIRIWYTENNQRKYFLYSGTEAVIPNNDYVQVVVEAYAYNKKNWENMGYSGNSPSTNLVQDKNIIVNVFSDINNDSMYYQDNGGIAKMIWNPYEGMITDNNIVLSPATIFAHESDHAFDDTTNTKRHSDRKNKIDKDYSNREEYRVISGSEQLSAIANGETKAGVLTRTNHNGKTIITRSVTSSIIDWPATRYYYSKIKRRP